MRVLSIEWARFGIKLNSIAAGQFATDTLLVKYPQPIVDSLADTIPAGRLGRPEEIAWMVAYLASPAADFLSGTVLTLDGARDNWLGGWPPTSSPMPMGDRWPRPDGSRSPGPVPVPGGRTVRRTEPLGGGLCRRVRCAAGAPRRLSARVHESTTGDYSAPR